MTSYINPKRIQYQGNPKARVLLVNDIPSEAGPFSEDELSLIQRMLPVPLAECALASLSQYKPANNDFSYLEGSGELAESKKNLENYIQASNPEIIISFGEAPLNFFAGEHNIYNWRGSPLRYKGCRYLPTLSPRTFGTFTKVAFDIGKAFEYSKGTLKSYVDNFSIVSDPLGQIAAFDEILAAENVTIDIETKRDGLLTLLCVGFGLSDSRAICMPVRSDSTHSIFRQHIPEIKNPIYHNGIFDLSVLRHYHSIPARPAFFDTLVAQHIVAPEMEKDLGFICSIFTSRPCYWGSVKFDDDKTWNAKKSLDDLYHYNCLDTVVTYEAFQKLQLEILADPDFQHVFEFEMKAMEAAMHVSNTGFCVDMERKQILVDYITQEKQKDYTFLFALGAKINMASPVQVKNYLYETLGLPIKKGRDGKVTTGEDALVGLIQYCKTEQAKLRTEEAKMKWRRTEAILKIMLNIRKYDKLLSSYVNVPISNDGRLRGWYKSSSTESGRWAANSYIDDTGFNPQTLPRESIEVPE